MQETELKPCPFCGGEARLQRKVVGYYVICKKCGCRTPYYQYQYAPIEVKKQEAIEAWNRRT